MSKLKKTVQDNSLKAFERDLYTFKDAAKSFTKKAKDSPKLARQALINAGVYTKSGNPKYK